MSRMKDIATELEDNEPDMVNHPPHYTAHPKGIECIDVIEDNPFYNLAAAMKYLWRVSWGGKFDDLEDLEKAVWYVQREITRRRDMQAPEPATPLFPPFMQEAMAEMLSRPAPMMKLFQQEQCNCETCVQARLEDKERGFVVVPVVQSDKDKWIGVATMGENWFEVPLPGFGTGPASPVVPNENEDIRFGHLIPGKIVDQDEGPDE